MVRKRKTNRRVFNLLNTSTQETPANIVTESEKQAYVLEQQKKGARKLTRQINKASTSAQRRGSSGAK
jgi:hypothetical protein